MLHSQLPTSHDVPAGPLRRCQITGSEDLRLVIDVGHQPLCDTLLDADALSRPERTFPLRLFLCPDSGLAQLDYVVDGSEVYHPDYPYRSGITRELAEYQRAFADDVASGLGLPAGALVVDIGSNDGTLLTGFARRKMRVIGVEPTNIARIARVENGVETVQDFFTEALARDIVAEHGRAQLVTATNVFAHMASLGEVMRGLIHLLDEKGVFITESHYLLDVVEKCQFDTVYHEHIRTYSLKSLVQLFDFYGLDVFDVQRSDRYGGNIRAYVCRRGQRPISPSVGKLLKLEEERLLFSPVTLESFRSRVLRNRDSAMEFAYRARRQGLTLVGNSCPGRCVTLLNFYGIDRHLMPYIAEQPSSLKLGLYVPGTHIPVVDNKRLIDEQPDYVMLLAWHYAQPIAEQLRARGLKSKFIVPLPDFEILDV